MLKTRKNGFYPMQDHGTKRFQVKQYVQEYCSNEQKIYNENSLKGNNTAKKNSKF